MVAVALDNGDIWESSWLLQVSPEAAWHQYYCDRAREKSRFSELQTCCGPAIH
jgi:hypothetical protein